MTDHYELINRAVMSGTKLEEQSGRTRLTVADRAAVTTAHAWVSIADSLYRLAEANRRATP